MAVKLNSELAAFFETGDQPSETEFGHLIDTIQPPLVTLANDGSQPALSVANHAFRTLVLPNVSANTTLILPTPAANIKFHLVYLPGGDDGHYVHIQGASADEFFFEGTIHHSDTNVGSGQNMIPVHGGSDNDKIKITSAQFAEIHLLGKNATTWYVWGMTSGDTPTTVDNS